MAGGRPLAARYIYSLLLAQPTCRQVEHSSWSLIGALSRPMDRSPKCLSAETLLLTIRSSLPSRARSDKQSWAPSMLIPDISQQTMA